MFLDFVADSGDIAEKSKGLPPIARPKKRGIKLCPKAEDAWGKLISQSSEVYLYTLILMLRAETSDFDNLEIVVLHFINIV